MKWRDVDLYNTQKPMAATLFSCSLASYFSRRKKKLYNITRVQKYEQCLTNITNTDTNWKRASAIMEGIILTYKHGLFQRLLWIVCNAHKHTQIHCYTGTKDAHIDALFWHQHTQNYHHSEAIQKRPTECVEFQTIGGMLASHCKC